MRKLKYQSKHEGNCRLYFYCKHNKRRYCLQVEAGRARYFELFTCSREGEPEMHLGDMSNYEFYKIPNEKGITGEALAFLKSIKR